MNGTDAAWAGVAVSAVTLAWAVTLALLRSATRRAVSTATISGRLDQLTADIGRVASAQATMSTEILTQIREDRAATNHRIRYLEETLWTLSPKARSPTSRR